MNATIDAVLLWLLHGSLWWAALAVGLALWFRVRPPRTATVRHASLAAAILAGTLAGMLPRWGAGFVAAPTALVADAAKTDSPPDVKHFLDERVQPAADGVATETSGHGGPAIPTSGSSTTSASASLQTPAPTWDWWVASRLALGAFWVAGTLVLGVRLARAVAIAARWRREAQPLSTTECASFDAVRREMDVRRRVEAGLHPGLSTPLVLCGRPPLVLAPGDWTNWEQASRLAAWRHELAHVRRCDDWWRALSEALRVVWWFHPGLRWLLARREHEAELLSDEAAVAGGCPPRKLAQILIDACRRPRLAAWRAPAGAFLAPQTTKARIARLIDAASAEALCKPTPRGLRFAAVCGAILLAFAGSMRWIAAAEPALPPKDVEEVRVIPDGAAAAGPSLSGTVELPTGLLFRRQANKVAVVGPNPRPLGFKGLSVDPQDGRVVEELQWKHVQHVDVFVKANDGRDFKAFAKTKAGGAFAFDQPLPPGGYQVDAAAFLELDDDHKNRLGEPSPDLHAGTVLIRVKEGDQGPIQVVLKLHAVPFTRRLQHEDPAKRMPELRGTLTRNGKPVPDAKIVLYGGFATRWRIAETATDAAGKYRFENVSSSIMGRGADAKHYVGVQVEHARLVPADGKSWRDLAIPVKPGTVETLDLALTEGGFIEGRLLSTDGKPRAKAPIRMYIPAKPGVRRGASLFHAYATTDERGEFRSPPLFAGKYFVEENARDYPLLGEAVVEADKTLRMPGK
jgi:beta-lactamase regulating signal transducer with metallopeptidase domain